MQTSRREGFRSREGEEQRLKEPTREELEAIIDEDMSEMGWQLLLEEILREDVDMVDPEKFKEPDPDAVDTEDYGLESWLPKLQKRFPEFYEAHKVEYDKLLVNRLMNDEP